MTKPLYSIRRLPTPEADVFLDELYLSRGLKAQPHASGWIVESPTGNPILRVLNHADGQSTLYLHNYYFNLKEPF